MFRTQEDAAIRLGSLNAERDDLKSLLGVTLQRLEAVDEVVHRADMSAAMMEDKVGCCCCCCCSCLPVCTQ